MMDLNTFHQLLAQPRDVEPDARGYPLDHEQRAAADYGDGPLWLLAGPGSGKSEVLVTRTLKLLCVDGVKPHYIFLTTFTKKAGRNLEDRLSSYLSVLQKADPALRTIDLADLRVGTLHSLCNDILQEYRFQGYRNVRLLDDVEQHLFTYRHADMANCEDLAFWTAFQDTVPAWGPGGGHPPGKWKRVKATVTLFNRIVEDLVNVDAMEAQSGPLATLAAYYRQYAQALQGHYRCDFAHLQARFRDFLASPAGALFLNGNGSGRHPLRYVLVDEYQDTNPIQERIYLALASPSPHNLTVVGDDDQALYRFRGGTVSCMVNFDKACDAQFHLSPQVIQLKTNYRSHPKIVEFFNNYISSFPVMAQPGVRAPGKLDIDPGSSIAGSYPAVSWITATRAGDLPGLVASFIEDRLLRNGVIDDISQCLLLLPSTKDSPGNAGPFLAAFRQRGLAVYNPRSKSFMDAEEVQSLLAVLIQVIDHDHTFLSNWNPELRAQVQSWVTTLDGVLNRIGPSRVHIEDYLKESSKALKLLCQSNPASFLNVSLAEIAYRVLSLEPFRAWRQDPVRNLRLSKVTRLLDSYHTFNLDTLRSNDSGTDLDQSFRERFYYILVAYLIDAGVSDDEDEEVIVPRNYLSVMTIHQAKGLEFPIVIVGRIGGTSGAGAAQILEQQFAAFRDDLYPRASGNPAQLATEDDIRLRYVAYSRAQYALVLVATPSQAKGPVAIPGSDFTTFRRNTPIVS